MLSESPTEARPPILAISGGIDSMTLLWLYREVPGVVVAHFNHGARPSADDDEEFVRKMVKKYGLVFESERAMLGEGVSEAEARRERYRFLSRVAEKYGGEIYVAHHLDDVVESMAINFLRGTGWRGLAVMGNPRIVRPMLTMDRRKIYQIVEEAKLTFRQDPTNAEDIYLRNRVRQKLSFLSGETKKKLGELRQRQVELMDKIDLSVKSLLPENRVYQRAWFLRMDDTVALEILRMGLLRAEIAATRPQILDFLRAIREYAPGKVFNLPGGKLIKIHKTYFVL